MISKYFSSKSGALVSVRSRALAAEEAEKMTDDYFLKDRPYHYCQQCVFRTLKRCSLKNSKSIHSNIFMRSTPSFSPLARYNVSSFFYAQN